MSWWCCSGVGRSRSLVAQKSIDSIVDTTEMNECSFYERSHACWHGVAKDANAAVWYDEVEGCEKSFIGLNQSCGICTYHEQYTCINFLKWYARWCHPTQAIISVSSSKHSIALRPAAKHWSYRSVTWMHVKKPTMMECLRLLHRTELCCMWMRRIFVSSMFVIHRNSLSN